MGLNFSAVHACMQAQVDGEILAGISSAVLVGREVVDQRCVGFADRENRVPLNDRHVFRMMSNTKLVTSCAVLLLFDEGRFGLDDPIERFIPELGARKVLRAGARTLDDCEPARGSISVRHLLTHTSGLSYGPIDPSTLLGAAYVERGALDPRTPLSKMIDVLAALPLGYQPGTAWEYSIATDVLGRLVEVVSGQRFDEFIRQRIFEPLGMVDTGFVVPVQDHGRLAAHYSGVDLLNPLVPGLNREDNLPFPGAFKVNVPRLSGGGGLVSSLPDQIALIRSLLPGGPTLLKPSTIDLMMRNQLPEGLSIRLPKSGVIKGKGFGLGGAVTLNASSIDPRNSEGEFQWGGMYGTHWWIAPRHNLASVNMAQRQGGFWNPYSFQIKRLVYEAAGV